MARNVRVSTVAFLPGLPPSPTRDQLYGALRDTFKLVAVDKPDIALVSEAFNLGACPDWAKAAEPVPGPTSEVFAGLARKYRMHLWCPMVLKRGGRNFNAAVLFDRRGEIIGAYHKMFPTDRELAAGIRPGRNVQTFETDFGRVGACICFDAHFHEVGEALAREGAEIVFFPSMFVAERCLMSWAVEFGYFIVTSCGNWSFIMSNLGRIRAETGARFESVRSGSIPPIASAVINLDTVVLHHDRNQEKVKSIKEKYGAGVEFEYAQYESMIAMSSTMPRKSAGDIAREFKLIKRSDYIEQSRAACNRLRGKR